MAQRVIVDYSARKTDIAGTPAFATQYSNVFVKSHIIDNATSVNVGDVTLPITAPLLSTFTANASQYLQIVSALPFYIKTTISGTQSQLIRTSLFSYYNSAVPIDSIEVYNGSLAYDSGTASFQSNGGTSNQTITYMLLRF